MSFDHVTKGQPIRIPASDWNAVMDVTREAMGNAYRLNATHSTTSPNSGIVLAKNNTDGHGNLPRFSVVGLDGVTTDPSTQEDALRSRIIFGAIEPQDPDHKSKFGVLIEAVPYDAIGRVCVSGVVQVKIACGDEDAASSIVFADIVDGETGYLAPSDDGARVLWVEASGTERWAIVRLGDGAGGGLDIFPAKITGSSAGKHAWTEQQVTIVSGALTFVDLDGGRTGTTNEDPAYEINKRASVPNNTIVWLTHHMPSEVYLFDLGMGVSGTAKDWSYSGEHADSASSETWSIDSQTTYKGLKVTLVTGIRYDDTAATPKLYSYQRDLTFDASGHLVAMSAETRVEIDTPEECDG